MIRKLRLIYRLLRAKQWIIRLYDKDGKESKLDVYASTAQIDNTLFRIGEAAYTKELQDANVELTKRIINDKW